VQTPQYPRRTGRWAVVRSGSSHHADHAGGAWRVPRGAHKPVDRAAVAAAEADL